jgi:hypothetical protein
MRQKKYVFGNFSPLWCWVWRFCLFVRGLVGPVYCLNNQRGISSHTRTHLYKEREQPKPIPRFFRFSRFRSSHAFARFALGSRFRRVFRLIAVFCLFSRVSSCFANRCLVVSQSSFVRRLVVGLSLFLCPPLPRTKKSKIFTQFCIFDLAF